MTRAEALAAAIEHVQKIAPSVNQRGFLDGVSPLTARGELILQFAAFLYGDSDAANPNANEDPNLASGVNL